LLLLLLGKWYVLLVLFLLFDLMLTCFQRNLTGDGLFTAVCPCRYALLVVQ
jgi:hypothetical protein